MTIPVEAVLFVFLLLAALTVAHLTDLFAAAMVTGVFSLMSAGLFTLMDAVDVAFTEAAVGTGISTVLLLSTLALTHTHERQQRFRLLPLLLVTLVGAALVYGTLDMPPYGDPTAPIHLHVAPAYIAGAIRDFGIPNIVTNILASYRGFDTLGETTVVLTATVGVMLLLGALDRPVQPRAEDPPPPRDPRGWEMARVQIARLAVTNLAPIVLLFALYVQFHGDFGPGGGFQAGVLFGAALIMHGLVFGLPSLQWVVPRRWLEVGLGLGLLLYAGTGMASLFLGGNYLDYAVLQHDPKHGRHLGILLVEAGVGITVSCAMLLIFYFFAGRKSARSTPAASDAAPTAPEEPPP